MEQVGPGTETVDDVKSGLRRIPNGGTLHQLEELIVCPDERTLEAWRWYKLVEKGDETARTRTWPFLHRVKEGRELLLYAQRAYIKRRFDYDPARADMWEQHDRPWDFGVEGPSA